MESIPRAVYTSTATRTVSAQAQMEARRLGHHYLEPEHLLLGDPATGRGARPDPGGAVRGRP
jgi:Clp amino terminal domain, pathogenicity island component